MDSREDQLAEILREFESRSKAKVIVESGLYALIVLFVFVGNCLTLLVMLLNRRMRTIPNMFVASLAVSDLLIGLNIGPLSIAALLTSYWPFNNTTCQFQGYLAIALAMASIQTSVLMAVNRYYRIVKPTKYCHYYTKKKTLLMILVTWFYSICAPLIYANKMVFHASKFICFILTKNSVFLAYIIILLHIGIPTCVIIYCYFRIFTTVRHHNSNLHHPGNPISTVNVEEVKVAHTILVIVVFLNLCWIPIFTIDFVDTIFQRWIFPREAYMAYTFLATISSALNPVIYGVLNKSFRKNYLKVLRCRSCRSQAVVEPLPLRVRASVVAMGPLP